MTVQTDSSATALCPAMPFTQELLVYDYTPPYAWLFHCLADIYAILVSLNVGN